MSLAEVERGELVEPEVDLSTLTLDELGAVANAEHAAVGSSIDEAAHHMAMSLLHAIRAGQALTLAREMVEEGRWTEWLTNNVDISQSLAMRYVRYAHYEQVLREANVPLNADTALRYLKGLAPVRVATPRRTDPAVIAEAQRLRAGGLSFKAIGELLGLNASTIQSNLTASEESRRRRAKNSRRHAAARRALAEQERRAERDRLAKTGTENQQEIYRLIRRAAKLADIEGGLADVVRPLMKAEEQILAAIDRSEHGS